jgi:hypothetical protein
LETPLDASVVVLGPLEVYGTGMIRVGRNALLYPFLYLETEDEGSIDAPLPPSVDWKNYS